MKKKQMSVEDVCKMSLESFQKEFHFIPTDAIEKKWFAVTGKRIDKLQRDMISFGVLGPVDVSTVVMA